MDLVSPLIYVHAMTIITASIVLYPFALAKMLQIRVYVEGMEHALLLILVCAHPVSHQANVQKPYALVITSRMLQYALRMDLASYLTHANAK